MLRSFGTLDYADSKLANLWLMQALAQRFEREKITSNAYHPGLVQTELFRSSRTLNWLSRKMPLYRPPATAAADIVDIVTRSGTRSNGSYFARRRVVSPSGVARDVELIENFWLNAQRIAAWLSYKNSRS